MNKLFIIIFKILKRTSMFIYSLYSTAWTWIKLKGNGVQFSSWSTNGVPMIDVTMGAKMALGKNFRMNNGRYYNKIGRQQPCMFVVSKGGELIIGNDVGMSATTFFCTLKITVGDNVKIGGNCVFYDTDFHSLNYLERRDEKTDNEKRRSAPVTLEDDVFIGAHSTILKGVTIGKGSIIGAGSVVSKSVPPGQIWGGSPAVFIKSI
ncbi:MAG: acyltransferase [Ferruginibacter sp.]